MTARVVVKARQWGARCQSETFGTKVSDSRRWFCIMPALRILHWLRQTSYAMCGSSAANEDKVGKVAGEPEQSHEIPMAASESSSRDGRRRLVDFV